jgi:DMSO/TMAO reductase YedYZ heme-binding membrane subunit
MANRRAPVIAATAAALGLLVLSAGLVHGFSEASVRIVVRWTAKIAVVLFAAAFSAGSLRAFWRSETTRFLMVNRRRLGLAFALAHGVHLLALIVLGLAFPTPFVDGLDPVTLVGGGLAYAFVLAMAATSNDASVRRLGARRWRALHTVGGWYVWLIFTQSYAPRAAVDPAYVPFAVLLVGVAGLRIARWQRVRRGAAQGVPAVPGSPGG